MLNSFRSLSKDENDGLKVKLSSAVKEIEVRRINLNNIKYRLNIRCKSLLEIIKRETERKNDAKVDLYTVEYSTLENVVRIVDASELALAQIIIRLETVSEMREVIYNLSSALKVVEDVGKSASWLLPRVESFFDEFNSTLNETLVKLQKVSPVLNIDLKTEEGEELVEEAIKYVEKKVMQEEILESILSTKDKTVVEDAKKVVMLVTGETVDEQRLTSSPLLPKNLKLDKAMVDYIYEHKANLNIFNASNFLNMPVDEFERRFRDLPLKAKPDSEKVG
ncbi:MAG: hypothetical protein L6N94_06230 [Candidatus Methylarchaceae archaeon HK01M]|nr:hypothetical protein [Candidatus Methylarchaceae archaeon HK01M]